MTSIPPSDLEKNNPDDDATALSEEKKVKFDSDMEEDDKKSEAGSIASTSNNKKVDWTWADVFSLNPTYVWQVRGILNAIEIILSVLSLSLIASACEQKPFAGGSAFFNCRSADTFAFVVACSTCISAALFYLCCLLAKKTEARLFNTSFELGYYSLYLVLNFLSSVIILTSLSDRNSGMPKKEDGYSLSLVGGIFAATNAAAYAVSVIFFLVTHLKWCRKKQVESE